jgi:DNA-binding response OmpR family regulator
MVQAPATRSLGKLLLVEDDPSVASQLVRGLGNAGFGSSWCATAPGRVRRSPAPLSI